MPTTISGFAVIPVSYDSSTTHYLYARPHSSKGKRNANQTTLPDGRTLFLVNVPPDATERELVLFFKHAGTVEKVVFGNETQAQDEEEAADDTSEDDGEGEDVVMEDPDGMQGVVEESAIHKGRKGKKTKQDDIPELIPLPVPPLRKLRKTGLTAHVVFLDVSSLERALASTSEPRAWPFSASAGEPCGLAHYQAMYASLRPPLDSVKAFADSAMEVYEYNVQKEKQKSKYKKGEAIVDEDGFTLVTRGGAYGKTLGGGVGVASKKFQRSAGQARSRNQKKEKKEKEGFYSFQKADKQRAGLF